MKEHTNIISKINLVFRLISPMCKLFPFLYLMLLIFCSSSCGVRIGDIKSPILTPKPVSTRTVAIHTPIVTLSPDVEEIDVLSTNPPWLYYYSISKEALIVLSWDGSEKITLHNIPPPASRMQSSSNSIHIAYVTCSECTPARSEDNPSKLLNDKSLIIFNVPEGKVESEIALTSPISTYTSIGRDMLFDISEAVGSFAWSPDGRTLAFTAATDGVSSDLYAYNVENMSITRLTWGPGQAYSPIWSPDGKWIVHQEVRQLTHALGYRVDAVWASSLSDSNNINLNIANGDHQWIKKWISETDFIVIHEDEDPGLNRLYKASIKSDEFVTLYEGPFSGLAMDNNGRSALLWLINDEVVFIEEPYTISGISLELNNVSHLYFFKELDAYVVSSDHGISFVSKEGEVIGNIKDSGHVVVAPNGEWLAIYPEVNVKINTGSGLRVYTKTGEFYREISSGDVDQAFWSPDGSFLYWVEDMKLYNFRVKDGDIKLVLESLPELWSFDFLWIPE